ncbi:MAG: hypothetical protein HOO96_43720, partial [Polyangiaceae bacterium]|nr:hypothetical protein [Polyangiaceae bacterium]
MLAVSSDMAAPKDINFVGLTIKSGGREVFATRAEVGANGEVHFPATLAVLAPDDAKQPVRIRVIAYSNNTARVLRDMTVTVPPNRTGQLRIALNFLSLGSGIGEAPTNTLEAPLRLRDFDAFTQIQNRCGEGSTDVGGDCTTLDLSDPSMFDEYDPTTVFGGGAAPVKATGAAFTPSDGECFPVECCFEEPIVIAPDDACTVPSQGPKTNLALRTAGIGTVTAGGPLVPLDFDADPRFGEVGVKLLPNARLQLPPAVCRKMRPETPEIERVVSVVASTRCAPKSKQTPLCGPAGATSTARCGDVVIPKDGGPETGPKPDGGTPKPIELLASGLRRPEGIAVLGADVFVADVGVAIKKISGGTVSVLASNGTTDNAVGLAALSVGGVSYLAAAGAQTAFTVRTDGTGVIKDTRPARILAVGSAGDSAIFPVDDPHGEEFLWIRPGGGSDALTHSSSFAARSFESSTGVLLVGTSFGDIVQCPLGAYACLNPTAFAPQVLGGGYVSAMAASGGRVYYQLAPNNPGGEAHLYVYDPTATTKTAELAAGIGAGGAGLFGGIATDGVNVYFASGGILYAVPRSGGRVRVAPAAGDSPYPLGIGAITVDPLYVY